MARFYSAGNVRKALRKFLMKTHPDFFERDADKRLVNEKGLSSINALFDGATTKKEHAGGSRNQLPASIEVLMHYKDGNKDPFTFKIRVPSKFQKGAVDAEDLKKFCSKALLDLLVAAGEAEPTDSTWSEDVQPEEWGTFEQVARSDLMGSMKDHFFRCPPLHDSDPVSMSETDWAKRTLDMRTDYWMSRMIISSNIPFLEVDQAKSMMRDFCSSYPRLLNLVYDFPVILVRGFEEDEARPLLSTSTPGCLIVTTKDTKEKLAEKIVAADRLRSVVVENRRRIQEVLDICDSICYKGNIVKVSIGKRLAQEKSLVDILETFLKSKTVYLFVGTWLKIDVEKRLTDCKVSPRLGTLDVYPVVNLTIPKDNLSDALDRLMGRLSLRYCLNGFRWRSRVNQKILEISSRHKATVSGVSLSETFRRAPAKKQLREIEHFEDFVETVLSKGDRPVKVLLGAPSVVYDGSRLGLPLNFTMDQLKRQLTNKH